MQKEKSMNHFKPLKVIEASLKPVLEAMDYWEILEEKHVDETIEVINQIIAKEEGVKEYSPEAIADLCVDHAQAAKINDEENCSNACYALAGFFYAAGELNNSLSGYSKLNEDTFKSCVARFINSAVLVEGFETQKVQKLKEEIEA